MFKIKTFKLRKNERYNYTPRYYNGKDEGNIYDFDSRFAKFKGTPNQIDFGSHWAEARKASRTRGNRSLNKRVLLIAAILILIFLWIIDFDLSIFTQQQ
ncbi:hypothetical protein [Mesohalobacter halotolerans]|jgi:hypothetical protein|uniref:Riboflavin synthase subunit beta n=1 Tax=Mesohalobacter halotolerans TaxID=1883405 RepID=A0A4U5TQZ3_9FLAO|nr:hypothetical protein [Mesohalobacter halotolerans]MBS3739481.1 hypothetical protein [Psychroflexus sp.]NBC57232.1 hypothetical protein [Bacteroidota bacterium]TKS56362.1 hypothetical protein FCN74_04785 [Mesohalobacter halotolerans]